MKVPTLSFKEEVDTLDVDIHIPLEKISEEMTIKSDESKLLYLAKAKLIETIKQENNLHDFQIPKNLKVKLNSFAISKDLAVNLTLQAPSNFIAQII